MIAVACVATGVAADGMGLEAAHAVTASPARRGVEGMKAPTAKTSTGMKGSGGVVAGRSGTKRRLIASLRQIQSQV